METHSDAIPRKTLLPKGVFSYLLRCMFHLAPHFKTLTENSFFCFSVMGPRHSRVCPSPSDIWRECLLLGGHKGVHRVWHIRKPSAGKIFRVCFKKFSAEKPKQSLNLSSHKGRRQSGEPIIGS